MEIPIIILKRIRDKIKISPLLYYLVLLALMSYLMSVMGAVSGVITAFFLLSVLSGKALPRKLFFLLLIVSSLHQTSYFIDYDNLDRLLMNDDYLKFYYISVENADMLLRYGTPFGFNHDFQGGIPSLYHRSCFLELIPFSAILGSQAGYQAMLIFFIAITPFSLYLLLLETTKSEDMARLVSFISTFQLAIRPTVLLGLTPSFLAISLSFLSLLFLLRYLDDKKHSLFPLSLFMGVLAYTHIAVFAVIAAFFAIIFAYRMLSQKNCRRLLSKMLVFCLLNLLICLPLYYGTINYSDFFKTNCKYHLEKIVYSTFYHIFHNNEDMADWRGGLLLLVVPTLCFYLLSRDSAARLITRNALLLNLLVLAILSLKDIPLLFVFVERFDWLFMQYLLVFNASLFVLFRMSRPLKAILILLVLLLANSMLPPATEYLETFDSISEIDNEISGLVSPNDYVLFENCDHISPTRNGEAFDKCPYNHWTTYLQKKMGAKFFSNIDEDPNPFNALNKMYVTSGTYDGYPLYAEEKTIIPRTSYPHVLSSQSELVATLADWGVNKACVWSPTAKIFFGNSTNFSWLGESEIYSCYAASYKVMPEVRPDKTGTGAIIDETPFSFTVILRGMTEKQTITINKNYFNLWSAHDEQGNRIDVRRCGQKICFEAIKDGYVRFEYSKNIPLVLISLLALIAALLIDIITAKRQANAAGRT
ncbi:MAG: hypothetical protein PHG85_04735 [Candidatus Altiarchaeota archaeon]|nr:hypothetical protein [Candidatus Altiarchaeota archaeon]